MKKTDLLNTITTPEYYGAVGDCIASAETIKEVKSNIDAMQAELTKVKLKMEDMDDGEFLTD